MTEPTDKVTTEQMVEWLDRAVTFDTGIPEWPLIIKNRDAIRSRLTEHDALKQEVERLMVQIGNKDSESLMLGNYLKKAEAELLTAQAVNAKNGAIIAEQMAALAALRGEAAEAGPLLKEIEEAVDNELDLTLQSMRVYEAALAYRAAREKKEGK